MLKTCFDLFGMFFSLLTLHKFFIVLFLSMLLQTRYYSGWDAKEKKKQLKNENKNTHKMAQGDLKWFKTTKDDVYDHTDLIDISDLF